PDEPRHARGSRAHPPGRGDVPRPAAGSRGAWHPDIGGGGDAGPDRRVLRPLVPAGQPGGRRRRQLVTRADRRRLRPPAGAPGGGRTARAGGPVRVASARCAGARSGTPTRGCTSVSPPSRCTSPSDGVASTITTTSVTR